jgi:hypothetical protein
MNLLRKGKYRINKQCIKLQEETRAQGTWAKKPYGKQRNTPGKQ